MKYHKIPEIIDAFQWTADINQVEYPEWIIEKIEDGSVYFEYVGTFHIQMCIKMNNNSFVIAEVARIGDYIIKQADGKVTSCSPNVFEKTYEPLDII